MTPARIRQSENPHSKCCKRKAALELTFTHETHHSAARATTAAAPPTIHWGIPVIFGIPPVLELEACTLAVADEGVSLGADVASGVVLGAAVMVDEAAEKEDELELCDDEDTDFDELEEWEDADDVVDEAVVGRTNCPAVTVRICAPSADAPLNVVVEEVAVEVMVPRMAFTDLVHDP